MPSVVQVLADNNVSGLANVHQTTISSSISVGDDIVVCVLQSNAEDLADGSVTDSAGNTYTLTGQNTLSGARRMGMWQARCATAMASGTDWIKFKVAFTNTAFVAVYALKMTGMGTYPDVDTGWGTTGTSTAPTSDPTPTTSQADEVAISLHVYNGVPSYTPPSGYSQTAATQVSIGTSYTQSVSYKVLSAIGAQTATGTLSSSQDWASLVFTYKFTAPTTRTLVPISDISSGGWAPSTGATLFGTIDESTSSDTDYDQSSPSPVTADVMEVKVQAGGNPNTTNDGASHHVKYRIGKNATGGDAMDVTVRLFQGATQIASWTHTSVDALTSYDQALTDGQANAITDYTNLRLRFEAVKQ